MIYEVPIDFDIPGIGNNETSALVAGTSSIQAYLE